eukprot:COSAG01_NODE_36226_length_520_cov_1.266033_1_plen_132_part_10
MTGSSSPTSSASHSCATDGTPAHQRSHARTPPAGGGGVVAWVCRGSLGWLARHIPDCEGAADARVAHTHARAASGALHTLMTPSTPMMSELPPSLNCSYLWVRAGMPCQRSPEGFRAPATNQLCACEPGCQQ